MSKVIRKHWNLLKINAPLKEIPNSQPIIVFRQNKDLKELIGTYKIENKKKKDKYRN